MAELVVITDRNFEAEIAQSDKPVLVYVTTRWCRPGRDLMAVVDQAAEEVKDRFKVGTLDADTEREFVRAHKVRSVPTVVLFKGGKPGGSIAGRFTKLQLMTQISALMVEEKPAQEEK